MEELSVIIPSFHSKELTSICIKGFEKFKPADVVVKYVVVENSGDVRYRDNIKGISSNLTWLNNETELRGSEANSEALVIGLKYVETQFTFLCHCDTCVTSSLFFDEIFAKVQEGYKMVGTGLDNTRINACHISGVFVDVDIAKAVEMFPIYEDNKMIMDVGDDITKYCRDENIKHMCLENTFNSFDENKLSDDKYKGFRVNRSVNDDGDVIFMHLGRGIPKTQGTYKKEGRVCFEDWTSFCEGILNG